MLADRTAQPLIMVVDDEENIRLLLERILLAQGYSVLTVDNCKQALGLYKQEKIAVTIVDIKMPEGNGFDVLKEIKKIDEEALVVMLTAFATIKTAVEAIKLGAFDYLTKPFEIEDVTAVVNRAMTVWNLTEENRSLRAMIDEALPGNMLQSNNIRMKQINARMKQVAQSDHTVLITGETGSGKSVLAKAIHQLSTRANGSFVWLNCAALPEQLVESELFGYEKGAFTGALTQHKGRMEMAHQGTLFLDEVSLLSLSAQGKLLLALQEGEFMRVGGTHLVRADFRIIAASNQQLIDLVNKGHFRADLFYRLNVIQLDMLPLRQRPEDIIPLANYFCNRYSGSKKVRILSPDVACKLLNYHWPGNIREMENVIKQALVLAGNSDPITVDHILFSSTPVNSFNEFLYEGETLRQALSRIEHKIISTTLAECNHQLGETAKRLGVSVRTIYRYV